MNKSDSLTGKVQGRVYEWDVAQIGDQSPPYAYEVTADKIADYCRAVRYENPIYVNDAAARERDSGRCSLLQPWYTPTPPRGAQTLWLPLGT